MFKCTHLLLFLFIALATPVTHCMRTAEEDSFFQGELALLEAAGSPFFEFFRQTSGTQDPEGAMSAALYVVADAALAGVYEGEICRRAAKLLLDRGADINAREFGNLAGVTSLQCASCGNRAADLPRFLLEHGAELADDTSGHLWCRR